VPTAAADPLDPGAIPRRGRLRRRLLVGSIGVAFLEVVVAIAIGEIIGYPLMLVAMLLVSFVGIWVVKVQGLSTFRRVGTDLARGRPPGRPLVDGLLVAAAGILLLVPGFLTSALAVALLVPATRWFARNALISRWSRKLAGRSRVVLRALPRV